MFIPAFLFLSQFTPILRFMIVLDVCFCEEFREDNLTLLMSVRSGCTEFEDGIEVKQL